MSNDSDEGGTRATSRWQWLLLAAVIIYLLPFVAVLIDEKVLKTFWFSHHLSRQVGDVLRALYPFYKLFDW